MNGVLLRNNRISFPSLSVVVWILSYYIITSSTLLFLPKCGLVHGLSSTSTTTTTTSPSIVQRLLDRVQGNDRAGDAARSAYPFVVGGNEMGRIRPHTAAVAFARYPNVFAVNHDTGVALVDQPDWQQDGNNNNLVEQRTKAVAEVMLDLRDEDIIPALRGWRDELFAVRESFHASPELLVERACAVLLGVPAYGVFVNGYTCENSRSAFPSHVWIGKRSATKATWPSRYDSLAAGGLAAGMLPREAMVQECQEEAGISPEILANNLKAVSAVSYTGFSEDMWGLKRDVLFCFDLQLPPDFEPTPVDGEMERFEKVSIETLLEMLAKPVLEDDDSDNEWKTNVGVVLIDFLVRQGLLDSNDPAFLELIGALRTAKCC